MCLIQKEIRIRGDGHNDRPWGRRIREKQGLGGAAGKNQHASPYQNGDARPIAKIDQPNACGDTEEGETHHKTLGSQYSVSHKWGDFGGSARQLDQQECEKSECKAKK